MARITTGAMTRSCVEYSIEGGESIGGRGGNNGSGGDSGGASCAAAPPLRGGSGLLQQAVGTRLVIVGSQSAAH